MRAVGRDRLGSDNKVLEHLQLSAPIAESTNTPGLSPVDAVPRSSVPKAHGSKRVVSALDDKRKDGSYSMDIQIHARLV